MKQFLTIVLPCVIILIAPNGFGQSQMKFTPYSEYSNYLTNTLIEQTCETKHKEICEDGSVHGGVEVKVCYFRPKGWEYDFAYCQVNYIGRQVKESSQFLFYPDDVGNLSSDNYVYVGIDDVACMDCQLKDIRVENDGIVGEFYSFTGSDKDSFTKYMDDNFEEMTISWFEE